MPKEVGQSRFARLVARSVAVFLILCSLLVFYHDATTDPARYIGDAMYGWGTGVVMLGVGLYLWWKEGR